MRAAAPAHQLVCGQRQADAVQRAGGEELLAVNRIDGPAGVALLPPGAHALGLKGSHLHRDTVTQSHTHTQSYTHIHRGNGCSGRTNNSQHEWTQRMPAWHAWLQSMPDACSTHRDAAQRSMPSETNEVMQEPASCRDTSSAAGQGGAGSTAPHLVPLGGCLLRHQGRLHRCLCAFLGLLGQQACRVRVAWCFGCAARAGSAC